MGWRAPCGWGAFVGLAGLLSSSLGSLPSVGAEHPWGLSPEAVANGGALVIGGTSAGASILSRQMIREGSNRQATLDRGLGLLPGAIIDQHFLTRRRQPRLIGALAEHPTLVGVGVDEGAALVVQGRRIWVVGESSVMVYRAASGEQRLQHRARCVWRTTAAAS